MIVGEIARGKLFRKHVEIGLAEDFFLRSRAQYAQMRGVIQQKAALPIFDEDVVWNMVNHRAQKIALFNQ